MPLKRKATGLVMLTVPELYAMLWPEPALMVLVRANVNGSGGGG